ncbi:hypothetical protein [Thiocapsa marina]|uniref:hypothetical protein n=1 Tax=Thiocapsa marina TaxID=244573 RepID=UPI00030EF7C7|nr:hypothetical protein [Thiocapsa marina]
MSIAENQRPACAAPAADTLIRYLGHRDAVSIEALGQALRQLIQDPAQRQHLADVGVELVDGQGALRVVRTMQTITGGDT